ncbi:hypothetical protein HOLleu_31945 [Holothuria leucospilota]|uniref:Uncharacterized protein n=1 Tax=Holothuria leucospilota TaxID=206669 RepID=A0A9Q1BGM1_HOLLE|nr:hypothetical protein HOLleu_31945 [Holothuria leucospilota]
MNKKSYEHDKIISCPNNSRALYQTVARLTGSMKSNPLPECTSDARLADDFAHYFYNKIDKIRLDLEQYAPFDPPHRSVTKFKSFTALDKERVSKMIMKSKPSTCHLDPIPSSLIKLHHCDIFTPIILSIINASFSSCNFHTS